MRVTHRHRHATLEYHACIGYILRVDRKIRDRGFVEVALPEEHPIDGLLDTRVDDAD